MLTIDEQQALRWLRENRADDCDYWTLAYAIERLYPPGWNDPVTPERLVELGGVELKHLGPPQARSVNFESGACIDFYNGDVDSVDIGSQSECVMLPSCMYPRNMKEARELLQRCGAIKERT